jgi:putative methylase
VRIAVENAANAGLEKRVQWVAADIDAVCCGFDTVLENPPFGIQKRGADTRFLEKALETGRMIYSLHKHTDQDVALVRKLRHSGNVEQVAPDPFLARFVEKRRAKIRSVYAMVMSVPHMFDYHTKKKHEFLADLYVIETGRSKGRT